MSPNIQTLILSRNRLLIGAVVFLVLALAEGFLLAFTANQRSLPWFTLILSSGLFMAIGIREIAPVCLTESIEPWYARRHTLPYLAIILPALETFAALLIGILLIVQGHLWVSPVGYWLAFSASTLPCIAILNWPRASTSPEAFRDSKAHPSGRHFPCSRRRNDTRLIAKIGSTETVVSRR